MAIDLLADEDNKGGIDLLADEGASETSKSNPWKDLARIPYEALWGAGKEVERPIENILQLGGMPGAASKLHQYFPEPPAGIASTIGEAAGTMMPMERGLQGAEALAEGARAAPGAMNALERLLAQAGPKAEAARGIAGSMGYGAITNPENPRQGAEMGGALGVGAEAAAPAAQGAKAIVDKFSPQQYMEKMLHAMGGGKTVDETILDFRKDAQEARKKAEKEGGEFFNNVSKEAGESPIYGSKSGYQHGEYKQIFDRYPNIMREKTKKIHDEFIQNPIHESAHKLQSQIGGDIRKLESAKKDMSDWDKLESLEELQDALHNDMRKHLESKRPGLGQEYEGAQENWAKNVIPYQNDRNINKITSAFGKPKPSEIKSMMLSGHPDVAKIIEDAGPKTADKIIYSELARASKSKSPEEFTKNVDAILKERGISHLTSKELGAHNENLKRMISNRKLARGAAGFLGGELGAHALGLPWGVSEAIGTGLGAAAYGAPYAARGISKRYPGLAERINARSVRMPIYGLAANILANQNR